MNKSILCDSHEWAINSDNSGVCMRCKIKVNGVEEAKLAPKCTEHRVQQGSGWKPKQG